MAGIGTTRTQLKTAIGATLTSGTLILTAANVKLGYDRKGTTDQFFKDFSVTAPVLMIRGGRLLQIDPQTRQPIYGVKCQLYFAFPRETGLDMTEVEGLLDAIKARWDSSANGVKPPNSMTWDEPEIRTTQNPVVGLYEIELEIQGC